MLVITREGVQVLIRRLQDPARAAGCRDELQKMIEIKEALYLRAETGPSFAARRAMAPWLYDETRTLRAALQALDEGDHGQAASLVEEFYRESERNRSFPW